MGHSTNLCPSSAPCTGRRDQRPFARNRVRAWPPGAPPGRARRSLPLGGGSPPHRVDSPAAGRTLSRLRLLARGRYGDWHSSHFCRSAYRSPWPCQATPIPSALPLSGAGTFHVSGRTLHTQICGNPRSHLQSPPVRAPVGVMQGHGALRSRPRGRVAVWPERPATSCWDRAWKIWNCGNRMVAKLGMGSLTTRGERRFGQARPGTTGRRGEATGAASSSESARRLGAEGYGHEQLATFDRRSQLR